MKLSDTTLLKSLAYVDGAFVGAKAGGTFKVTNPVDGSVLAELPDFLEDDTRAAIDAAEAAWGPWRKKTAKERAAIMRRWYELQMANQEDLARIMTAEQGKPLAEAKGEVGYGASFLEWFAEEARRIVRTLHRLAVVEAQPFRFIEIGRHPTPRTLPNPPDRAGFKDRHCLFRRRIDNGRRRAGCLKREKRGRLHLVNQPQRSCLEF